MRGHFFYRFYTKGFPEPITVSKAYQMESFIYAKKGAQTYQFWW